MGSNRCEAKTKKKQLSDRFGASFVMPRCGIVGLWDFSAHLSELKSLKVGLLGEGTWQGKREKGKRERWGGGEGSRGGGRMGKEVEVEWNGCA